VNGTRTIKDIEGAREVQFEVQGGSVFVWGRGFSYEFDRGIFKHQIVRLLSMADTERAPL
jgi:hypothetical protein